MDGQGFGRNLQNFFHSWYIIKRRFKTKTGTVIGLWDTRLRNRGSVTGGSVRFFLFPRPPGRFW